MSAPAHIDLSALGIVIGHATDEYGATGLTVVRGANGPVRAGVAIFGRATGSRELHAASADHLVDGRIDAILLTGGSAYGLDAAAGVMRWCEEHGQGFPVGPGIVPIVPAAVVFDLGPLGRFDARPTPAMAYAACETASATGIAEGSVGAGTGATVGKALGPARAMKGGFGCATATGTNGALVAACAVVNALGDVRDADGRIIAGARGDAGTFVDTNTLALRNTTLAVVASNIPLSSVELTQLARAAGAAFFRRITPAGTSVDGDIVFAIAPLDGDRGGVEARAIEALAVHALESAIERAVRLARGRDGVPGLADHYDH